MKAWLRTVLPPFPQYRHMVGNLSIRLDGNTARGRTICFDPMEVALPDGGTQVKLLGPWYADQFVRTARGGRIAERVEARCCCHNMPAALAGATG